MKIVIQILFLACLAFSSSGQSLNHQYDSILFKSLQRYIGHPRDQNGGETGVNLLQVSKKDSTISVRSVYMSDKKFDILNFNLVIKGVNQRCNKIINAPFDIIVPVYFRYGEEDIEPLSEQFKKDVAKKIKKLKRHGYTISDWPVTVVEFGIITDYKQDLL